MSTLNPGQRSRLAWLIALGAGALGLTLMACGSDSSNGFSSPYSSGMPSGGGTAVADGDAGGSTSTGGDDSSTPVDTDSGTTGAADAASEHVVTSGLDSGTAADAAPDAPPPLTTLTLLNTNVNTIPQGEPVSGFDPMPNGATIDISVTPGWSMRANTTPAVVGSVLFVIDGTYAHEENASPYTLCGDDGNGNITPCTLPLGTHTLSVTQYSAPNLDGGAMPATTVSFTLVDGTGDAGSYDGGGDGGVVISL